MTRLIGSRIGTALAGVVFIALLLGLSTLGVAYGFGAFSTSKTVTAELPNAGPALGPGSEVEYRGVLVGSLGSLKREPNRAVLTIKLDPSQIDHIPSGVSVRLVPRSVFGDLYVDLVPPAHITGHIRPGAVLTADTSTPTVELDQALDDGYRLLTAVQPAKIDATLSAIAAALNGRGAALGRLVTQLAQYTGEVDPHTSRLIHDIASIGTVGRQVSANAPNLFRVVDDAIALSKTIAADQPTLTKILTTGPVVATQTDALLAANRARLITLVHQLHPVIGILGRHESNLTNTVVQLQLFLNGAARALGHGPYLRLIVAADGNLARGQPYTAAQCPRYGRMKGPNCPKGSRASSTTPDDLIQGLVDKAAGADTTDGKNPAAVSALQQRLAIADLLLAPVIRAVGRTS